MPPANRVPLRPRATGKLHLGKRGLYATMGGCAAGHLEHALPRVLGLADGRHDLVAIAARSGLRFELINRAANALRRVGQLATLDSGSAEMTESTK